MPPVLRLSGRYNVRVPTLPGCPTYGESIDDALANAHEAIAGYLAALVKAGEAVPIEEHPVVATTVVVHADPQPDPRSAAVPAAGAGRS